MKSRTLYTNQDSDGIEGWEIVSSLTWQNPEGYNEQQQQRQQQQQQQQQEPTKSIQLVGLTQEQQEQQQVQQQEDKNSSHNFGPKDDSNNKDSDRKDDNGRKEIEQQERNKDLVTSSSSSSSSTTTTTKVSSCNANLSVQQIQHWRQAIVKDSAATVSQNAAASTSIYKITRSQSLIQQNECVAPCSFSINIDRGDMPVTDQENSGRCWLFATLNVFRFPIRHVLKVSNFEFSESFLFFYHLLEQANTFCENIMEAANRPLQRDRLVQDILDCPIDDGGDWDIAVQLLLKYGIVPKSFYPETHSSCHVDNMLDVLNQRLLQTACQIRKSIQSGTSTDQIRQTLKADCVADTYRILCIHLGTPPTLVDWKWRDEKGIFHDVGKLTPLEFLHRYVTIPFDTYISCIQDPRHDYYQLYNVPYSMTIKGCAETNFLNLSSQEMKQMAIQMLQNNIPVVFACNVSEQEDDEYGLWDENLYNWTEFYQVPLSFRNMSKAERIEYGSPMGTHMMIFTGVDLENNTTTGKPLKWRVENSWGTNNDSGQEGYYTLNDNWFDGHVFELVVPLSYLNLKAKQALDKDPIPLPFWDPMQSTQRKRGGGGRRTRRRR